MLKTVSIIASKITFFLLCLFFLFLFIARLQCTNLLCVRNVFMFSPPTECTMPEKECNENCMECERTKELCEQCEACNDCKSKIDIRNGLDETGLIIFGISLSFLTLCFSEITIFSVFSRITKLSLFGIEVELEEVKNNINNITDNTTIPQEVLDKVELLEKEIAQSSTTPTQQLNLIFLEIRNQLNDIYQILQSKSASTLDQNILIEQIKKELKEDSEKAILDIASKLYKLREKELYGQKGKNIPKLIDIAIKLILLLEKLIKDLSKKNRKVYGHLKNFIIGNNTIKKSSNKNILWSVPVGFNDLNDNNFPINNLKINNFTIYETVDGKEEKAEIINIRTLNESKISMNVIIAIDCSGSMEGEKLIKSKDCALDLLKQLKQQTNIDAKVAIYIINDNRGLLKGKFFSESEFDILEKEIKNLSAKNSTPLWDSLFDIFTDSKKLNGTKLVILISDGGNGGEHSSKTFDDVKNVMNVLPVKQTYFGFIGYGSEDDYSSIEDLVNMSGLKKFGYFPNQSPQTITASFNSIFKTFAAIYNIKWKSTAKDSGKKVKVKIIIKHRDFDTDAVIIKNYTSV